jgi:hypothetical protein
MYRKSKEDHDKYFSIGSLFFAYVRYVCHDRVMTLIASSDDGFNMHEGDAYAHDQGDLCIRVFGVENFRLRIIWCAEFV